MSLLNPLTYLDLVQRFAVEVGATDDAIATTQDPEGQISEFCNRINKAWMDIQTLHPDWKFMRVSPGVSFVTVAGQMPYTIVQTGIARGVVNGWMRNTFRCYHTATGFPSEQFMEYVDYDDFRDEYQFGSLRTSQVMPLNFTIAPDLSLVLECPLPGYTITGDYHSAPLTFAADLDVPSLPAEFNMMIIGKAMMDYAEFESAPEVYAQGKTYYDPLLNRLEGSRLREIRGAGALA